MGTVFGTVIDGLDISIALKATVKLWQRTYLDAIARKYGLTTPGNLSPLPTIRSYPDSLDPSKYPEDQLPSLICVVPGTSAPPRRTGDGWITDWTVGVGVIVTAKDKDSSRALADYYAQAVRALIEQHPSLGTDFVTGTDWLSKRSDNLPIRSEDMRTLGAAFMAFSVQTQEVGTRFQGPTTPINDGHDPGDWPTVESTFIDAVNGEVTD